MSLALLTAGDQILSLAALKRHVHAEDFDDDDAYLQALASAAEDNIGGAGGFLGRALSQSEWELRLDCFPAGKIDIPLPPLISVDEVEYVDTDGVAQTYAAYRTFGVGQANAGGFILYAYNGEWPDTRDDEPEAVRVTFTAGYAAVPPAIKHAALLMVGDWYRNREDATEIKLSKMPRAADDLLAPYRYYA